MLQEMRCRGYMSRLPTPSFAITLASIVLVGPLAVHLVLPALPAIKSAFGMSDGLAQLTFSVALFAMALSTPGYGFLSDRYGRRPVLLSGLGLARKRTRLPLEMIGRNSRLPTRLRRLQMGSHVMAGRSENALQESRTPLSRLLNKISRQVGRRTDQNQPDVHCCLRSWGYPGTERVGLGSPQNPPNQRALAFSAR
jgi:hypothetical protein